MDRAFTEGLGRTRARATARGLTAALLVAALAWSPAALAATASDGISEGRLSLPEGPGSLEGIGENISMNTHMGQMQHSVPIAVPGGFAGLTPELALSYSSGSGNSVVGMGWSLQVPSIERLTVRGLPRYTTDDEFSVNGGDELVRIPDTDPAVYRARFEGSFVRYTWHDAGDGGYGYWTAEHPDGRIGYFGATADGTLVDKARVSGEKGSFRYLLVTMTDRYGHHVDYSYDLFGNKALPVHVGWVFTTDTPEYEVSFEYEDRNDKLSDCGGGFEELLTKRLSQVNVLSHGTRIRRYALSYEDYATSGGMSRLAGVQMYGLEDGAYPIHESYEYQRALGVDCQEGEECEKPYIRSLGSLGVDMQKGTTTLLDINGDSLPDVVDSSEPGKPHKIFFNTLEADGTHHFVGPEDSALGNQGGFALGSASVQSMDVNGDGFTDLLNAKTGEVLINRGSGDWHEKISWWAGGDGGAPDMENDFDPQDGALKTVRFMDYDNDKHVDIVKSQFPGEGNETFIYRNTRAGGFTLDPEVEQIGAGFESDRLELNDMNGDGMLDVVLVNMNEVRYRLNLGWGHWGEWVAITLDPPFASNQEAVAAELDDMNGDGLADLVYVVGDKVRYWINRNGASFDPERQIGSDDVDGEIPERTQTTTVLHADMNGNGSADVVWIDSSGQVTYLEIFPVRPNLLSRITNGIGRVTDVTYASSVAERARDEASSPWPHPLPFPMTVVKSTDEWDELSNVHLVTTYSFHDGYYDGVEKRFRGYARVQGETPGDELQEAGASDELYDVGAEDVYMMGKLLRSEQTSGDRSIKVTANEYKDCDVAGAPTDLEPFPVRHICRVRETVEHREGLEEATDWAATEQTWEYDGYGNVTLHSNLGVSAESPSGCESCDGLSYSGLPCGEKCLGDERYTRTTYALPEDNEDRWILNNPVSVRTYGVAGSEGGPAGDLYTETITYYDGTAFEGLPAGQVTHGKVTRTTGRVDTTGKTIDTVRNKLDEHGNVIETLDALGTAEGDTHRRVYEMDEHGLRVIRAEILLEDAEGPYRLRKDVIYDQTWDLPTENTAWMVVESDEVKSPRNSTYYSYDEFARVTSKVLPGDTMEKPTEAYEYLLGNPSSRVVVHRRTGSGEEMDLETVRCIDGRGRLYQVREKLSGDNYHVTGFTVFNLQGMKREVFDPYAGTGDACDTAPPDGTLSQKTHYDATGREIRRTMPTVGEEVGPIETLRVYDPMRMTQYDLEDTLSGGPHEDTPTSAWRNGLGQTLAVERLLSPEDGQIFDDYTYDELGRLATATDPTGATKTQTYDLLGRLVAVEDSDSGTTTFEYDDAGNLVRRVDARGVEELRSYDGSNRLIGKWDAADETGTRIEQSYDKVASCAPEKCTNVAGRLASVSYPLDGGEGKERYGYTMRGGVSFVEHNLNGRVLELKTDYDNAERVVGNVFPTGREIQVEVDGADRIVGAPGYIEDVSFDPRGLPASFSMANGAVTSITHDERKQLSSITVKGPSGDQLLGYVFTRDRAGNIVEVEDSRAAGGAPTGAARFTYDALYRLTQAQLDPDDVDWAETLGYTYDGGGRILKKESSLGASSPAHVGDYSYGAVSQVHGVTEAGAMTFEYDAAGHMTRRGEVSYTWDFLGRMASASDASGVLASFAYGTKRDRLLKRGGGHETWYLSPSFEVRDGTALTYVMLDDNRRVRIEEPGFAASFLSDVAPASGEDDALAAGPDGVITAADAWLAGQAVAGALTFADEALRLDDPEVLLNASAERSLHGSDPRVTYLSLDHRSSPVVETDGSGELVARSETYPYGTPRYESGDTDPHGFTGKERDKTTGLVDFGGRQLDPWTGRWTMPDPAFLERPSANVSNVAEAAGAYAYTDGNPVNHSDPTGAWKKGLKTGFWGRLRTTIKLYRGKIRPSVQWLTVLNMKPRQKFGWKQAWRHTKFVTREHKQAGITTSPFRNANKGITPKEVNRGIKHLRKSDYMSAQAYNRHYNVKVGKGANLLDLGAMERLRQVSTKKGRALLALDMMRQGTTSMERRTGTGKHGEFFKVLKKHGLERGNTTGIRKLK